MRVTLKLLHDRGILLDRRLNEGFGVLVLGNRGCVGTAKIGQLVALEVGHQGALMLFQDHLGDEGSGSEALQQCHDINLCIELFARFLMPLDLADAAVDTSHAAALEATHAARKGREPPIGVVVEIFAALCDRAHQSLFSLVFVFGLSLAELRALATKRGGREDSADQRVLQFECLVAAEDKEEGAPEDGHKTSDSAQHHVERHDFPFNLAHFTSLHPEELKLIGLIVCLKNLTIIL